MHYFFMFYIFILEIFFSKSMYIMDSNQYAIELVTYLLVLVVYFYELIVYMLLERNAFDSIPFFSQCRIINSFGICIPIRYSRDEINLFLKIPTSDYYMDRWNQIFHFVKWLIFDEFFVSISSYNS